MIESVDDQHGDGDALDEVFVCLADRTRRRLLASLAEHDARTGGGVDPADLAPADRDPAQFEADLHHNHLPRLQEAGFLQWDRDSDTVRRGPRFEDIEPLLALLDDHREVLPGEWP